MNEEAAAILVQALEKETQLHNAGSHDAIGAAYDDVLSEILPITEYHDKQRDMVMRFWDDWCDASNHNWLYHEPMKKEDWPKCAELIVQGLRDGKSLSEEPALSQFIPKPRISIIKRLLRLT